MNTKIPSNLGLFLENYKNKNYIDNDELEWPFEEVEFHIFCSKVLKLFCSEANKLEKILSEEVLCDIYFIACLVEYSNNIAITKNNSFQTNKFEVENSKKLLDSLSLKFNQDKVIFKSLLKNFIYSKKNFKKKFKIFGSRNEIIEDYLITKNYNFDYDYTENHFSIDSNIKNSEGKIIDFINSFFLEYQKLSNEYFKLELDFSLFKDLWLKRLNEIKHFKKNFKKNTVLGSDSVYFGNCENQYHRILSLVLKHNMIKTYSFDHGYDNYIKRKPTNYWFKSNYSFQVSLNKSSSDFLIKDINSNSPYPKNFIPNFLTFKNNVYISKKEKLTSKKKIKNIKTVMLLGFPMGSQKHLTEIGCFWYYKLLLEIKILKSLKKANYKVIYKIHPDKTGWESIISNYCDEIRYKKFEEKTDDVDLFIFTYTSNSCFTPALCSNIPILLFDTNLDPFNEIQTVAFNKRCKVLNIKFNKKGYIFDENNLYDSIENIDTEINNEYFEKFII